MKRHRGPIAKWITSNTSTSSATPPSTNYSRSPQTTTDYSSGDTTSDPEANPFRIVTKKPPSPKPPSPAKSAPLQTANRYDTLAQPTPTPTPTITTASIKPNDSTDTMGYDNNDNNGPQQLGRSSPELPTVEELMDTRT
jgi:hypothetical protein